MKKVLIAFSAAIFVLFLAAVGVYFYATSNLEQMVLKMNIDELVKPEFTQTSVVSNSLTGTMHLDIPLILGPDGVDQELNSKVTNTYDYVKNTVTVKDANGEETTVSIEEYEKNGNIFEDEKFWNNVIDEKDYAVEDSKVNGDSVWKYTFSSDTMSDELKSVFETAILSEKGLFNFGVDGLEAVEPNIDFKDGKFSLVLNISKKSYEVTSGTITFDGDIVISFRMQGDLIDAIVGSLESLQDKYKTLKLEELDEDTAKLVMILEATDGNVPDATGGFVIKEFANDNVWTENILKDGKKTPNNPLTVLIATKLM